MKQPHRQAEQLDCRPQDLPSWAASRCSTPTTARLGKKEFNSLSRPRSSRPPDASLLDVEGLVRLAQVGSRLRRVRI